MAVRTFALLSACILVFWAAPASAQNNCPLEVMRPGPLGPAGEGHDPANYIYRAFTGITWSIRATVRCGDWREYRFALKNAPPGMTVVPGPCTSQPCDAGTITWVDPTATARDVQLVVTDGDEQDTATWTVAVSTCTPGEGGCCVIDAAAGDDAAGKGTVASPWRTLAKAHGSCGARSVLYMRGAPDGSVVYAVAGLPFRRRSPGVGGNIDFAESAHPVIWIGFPGERPTIDLGYAGSPQPLLALSGANIWLDNFGIINPYTVTFSLTRLRQYGAVARRLVMRGAGPGINGANSSFLMFTRNDGAPSIADHVANNDWRGINYGTGNSCVKLYSVHNAVIEDNTAAGIHSRQAEAEGCFALKNSVRQFTLRHNTCSDFPPEIPCISGNMHASAGVETSGEIHHNNVILPRGAAYDFNQDGMAGPIRHWNNTWQGRVTARNVDGADGPFTFVRDVMVNSGGSGSGCPQRLSCDNVSDVSRLSIRDSLSGAADGRRVNPTTGALVEPYLTRDGPRGATPKGHMLPPRQDAARPIPR
jgi:hypothetical protein